MDAFVLQPLGPSYNNFQVDSFKLMELLGPEKVDPADVKLIKEKLFGYSTFWVTKEEPFGDLGEGILFLGNLRARREDVFAKFQSLLAEVTGNKYNLFMVEEPNSEDLDPRGGPRVSFGLLRKEVSEPGPTTLWQYVIAFLLFLLTIGSSVELGIASQVCLLLIFKCFLFMTVLTCFSVSHFEVTIYVLSCIYQTDKQTSAGGCEVLYRSQCYRSTRYGAAIPVCGVSFALSLWCSWGFAISCKLISSCLLVLVHIQNM